MGEKSFLERHSTHFIMVVSNAALSGQSKLLAAPAAAFPTWLLQKKNHNELDCLAEKVSISILRT
jgi:hypothetical protein